MLQGTTELVVVVVVVVAAGVVVVVAAGVVAAGVGAAMLMAVYCCSNSGAVGSGENSRFGAWVQRFWLTSSCTSKGFAWPDLLFVPFGFEP